MNISNWLASTALLAGMTIVAPAAAWAQTSSGPCANARDIRLINGKIETMDGKNSIVKEVTIQEGRFAFVGPVGNHKLNPCTRVVDLKGRAVIPGLIDNHNHFILFGSRPGHEVQLENVVTIPDAMATLKGKAATVAAGAWVVTIGDWRTAQFREARNPTLAEIDQAVPNNPVLLVPAMGADVTNSLGKKFFESKGIAVSDAGVIAAGDPTWKALAELRKMWTPEDAIAGTDYAQNYLLAYGLTTSVDMGFWALPGSPDLQDDAASDTIASLNPWTGYDAVLALYHQNRLNHRVRLFIISQDKTADLPLLKQRLLSGFDMFGDDVLRISGIGEFATPWPGMGLGPTERPDNFQAAMNLIAQHGWAYAQHTGTGPSGPADAPYLADAYGKANDVAPIANLHWRVEHARALDPQTLAKFKALNVGLAVHSGRYLSASANPVTGPVGPDYRTFLASGIHVGAGSDAGDFAVLNPWLNIYYIVTGKDVSGKLVNDGEQVSREQAIKLYTADNGWFMREEGKLGSIAPGELGDLAVLSADFFDHKKVSDEQIKNMKSVLTVVGGKIVYDALH